MSDLKICPACTYPYRGETCDNPACRAGSCATPENVARWDAEAARRKAEREECDWLSRVRSSCYGAIFALLALASCSPAPQEWGNSFVLYEDGSFELLEDGARIGSGCLDGQLCDDSRGANVHQLPLPAPGTSAARD